jgi:NADH-quinone oxidoreductase subunit L
MLIPLLVLALGALAAGYVTEPYFVGALRAKFWDGSILDLHHPLARLENGPAIIGFLPLIFALAGIAVAYWAYILDPDLPARFVMQFRALYLFVLNKWYFDELYDALLVRPAMALGRGLWKQGDGAVIDGLGPDGLAATTVRLAVRASRLQTGYVYHYAFVMLIGVVAFVTWYLLRQMW